MKIVLVSHGESEANIAAAMQNLRYSRASLPGGSETIEAQKAALLQFTHLP
jgi:hypothetical protein